MFFSLGRTLGRQTHRLTAGTRASALRLPPRGVAATPSANTSLSRSLTLLSGGSSHLTVSALLESARSDLRRDRSARVTGVTASADRAHRCSWSGERSLFTASARSGAAAGGDQEQQQQPPPPHAAQQSTASSASAAQVQPPPDSGGSTDSATREQNASTADEEKLRAKVAQMRKYRKIFLSLLAVFVVADVALLPFALSKYWERKENEAREEEEKQLGSNGDSAAAAASSSVISGEEESSGYAHLNVGAFPAAFVGRWGSTDIVSVSNPNQLQCFVEVRSDGSFKLVEINGSTGKRSRFVQGSITEYDSDRNLNVAVGLGLTSKFSILDPPKRHDSGSLTMTLCLPSLTGDGKCYVLEHIE